MAIFQPFPPSSFNSWIVITYHKEMEIWIIIIQWRQQGDLWKAPAISKLPVNFTNNSSGGKYTEWRRKCTKLTKNGHFALASQVRASSPPSWCKYYKTQIHFKENFGTEESSNCSSNQVLIYCTLIPSMVNQNNWKEAMFCAGINFILIQPDKESENNNHIWSLSQIFPLFSTKHFHTGTKGQRFWLQLAAWKLTQLLCNSFLFNRNQSLKLTTVISRL